MARVAIPRGLRKSGVRAFPGVGVIARFSDQTRSPDPAGAIRRLPRGAVFIFRDYNHPNRLSLARPLRALCSERAVVFLVAGDARLARQLRADGLHVPDWMGRRGPGFWKRHWRGRWVLSMAAHSGAGLQRAKRAHADLVTLSPVFSTASHPDAPALGARRFALTARRNKTRPLALGGVGRETLRRLRGHPILGVAGIGGLQDILRRSQAR